MSKQFTISSQKYFPKKNSFSQNIVPENQSHFNISEDKPPTSLIQALPSSNNKQNNYFKEKTKEQPQIDEPKITNIVFKFNVGCKLNLKQISLVCENSEYNKTSINALKMKLENPRAKALIFNSGKIIVYGTKNEIDAKKAARKIVGILKNNGLKAKFEDFQIINMCATFDFGFKIHLTQLYENFWIKNKIKFENQQNKVHYEPEIFPGLIYKMDNPKLTTTIFASGKGILVGAKERETFKIGFEKIYSLVAKYRNENFEKNEKDN